MAQNKIVIAPDTTTVTVSSVGLTGPAGADGTDAFPYTGSAIVSGSLGVIGETNLTGSVYLTNGTADDSLYALNNAEYYHHLFSKDPTSLTILNSKSQNFTGSTGPSFNLFAAETSFTRLDISGSARPTGYGLYQQTRVVGETKMNDLFNLVSIAQIGDDVVSVELDQLENFGSYINITGTGSVQVNTLIGIPNRVTVNNPNFTNTGSNTPFFTGLWNKLTLTTGSAKDVNSILLENSINSNFNIEGTFANLRADSDVIQSTSGSYNIYMPAAMDSVLGGTLILQSGSLTTGSAIVSGSLGVIGETNLTGSVYLTNGTADDSYYDLNNANYYRQSFIRNPSSFTIANNQHTDFTGSVSNAPILAGMVDFTDVRVSGSTSGDIYGIFNRTQILDYSKVRTVFGVTGLIIVSGSADSQANQTKELQSLAGNIQVTGNSPTTIEDIFGAISKVTFTNGNANVTGGLNGISTTLTLTSGSASSVANLRIFNNVNSNFAISGDFANILADAEVPTNVGGNAYNIYMPAAMDSVLGGNLQVNGTILTPQITASVVHSGSNYLIASPVSGDTNETIILTGSVYDNVSMVKVTHQRGSNGTFTVQLPDATAGNSINRTIRFISDSTVDNIHQIDISPSGSQTLDGGGGFTMNRGYEGIMVWSDGTEWFKIQAKNV